MEELISVVVPVYNVQDCLDKCLESIVSQTYENLEIIVIDDGSTDLSSKKCDEWLKKDNRIKVIHQENKGLAEARNVGISKSTGKYISFVDSDDFIDSKMIEILYKTLVKTNSQISVCKFKRVDNYSKVNLKKTGEIKEFDAKGALISLLKEDISVHIWDKLYLKDLFSRSRMPKGQAF